MTRETIIDAGEYLAGARKDEEHHHNEPDVPAKSELLWWWPEPDWVFQVTTGALSAEVACLLYFFRRNISASPPYAFRVKGISNAEWDIHYARAAQAVLSLLPQIKTADDYYAARLKYNETMGWPEGEQPKRTNDNLLLCPPYALGRSTSRTMNHPWTITQMAWFRQKYLHLLGWPLDPDIKPTCRYIPCEFSKNGRQLWAAVECVGSGVRRVSELSEDRDQAVAIAREKNKNGRGSKGREGQLVPKRPVIIGDAVRVGHNWLQERKITTDIFIEELGFRGIQWGEWVPQRERQAILNYAYEAFCDLIDIFGLQLNAASMYGKLGISFGARGKGFTSGAAHFEPSLAIIHLTRLSGAGSVAHEWAHALDNYLAEAAKKKFRFKSDYFSEAAPDQMWLEWMGSDKNPSCNAMLNVLLAMTSRGGVANSYEFTEYQKNANYLDKMTGNYWSSIREMFARAFETAVHDWLAKSNRRCDYLVYGVEEDRFTKAGGYRGNPYPSGEERSFINQRIYQAMNVWKENKRLV